MRVAHVLGYLAPHYGGPPQAAIRLGQALRARGMEVSWWSTATPAERRELAYLGPEAHLFATTWPRSWHRSPALSRALQQAAFQLDILHLHQIWDYPLAAAARAAQRAGRPYVVSPHGIFGQPWRYAGPKKALYLQLVARTFLDRMACVHAVAEAELAGFARVGLRAPATVIPNGIDPAEFSDLPPPADADARWPILQGRRVVLFLGRLGPEKGLDQLLPAWRNVVGHSPDVMLMLAGPDNRGYRAQVEAMMHANALAEHVVLPGMLQGQDKLLALARADIYVQPSYSEGFSIAVLEALASGKPCVIATGCNFPEVAQANCGVVVPPQAGPLAAALSEMLARTVREREQMGVRGRQLVANHYNWDVIARQWLTVYRCILEGAPIPLHPEAAI